MALIFPRASIDPECSLDSYSVYIVVFVPFDMLIHFNSLLVVLSLALLVTQLSAELSIVEIPERTRKRQTLPCHEMKNKINVLTKGLNVNAGLVYHTAYQDVFTIQR